MRVGSNCGTAVGRATTTKSRLNAILAENGLPGERVFAKQFDWFVVRQVGGPRSRFLRDAPSPEGRPYPPPNSLHHSVSITMYNTTGQVHHEGVANEANTIALLNDLNIYSETVEKRGGTKSLKEDAVAGNNKISIKRKKSITTGSFDWFNTTAHNAALGDTFKHFLSNMKELRQLPTSIRCDEEFITKMRDSFNALCELALDSLDYDDVRDILLKEFDSHRDMDVVINATDNRTLYKFKVEQHPVVKLLENRASIVLQGGGKSSRTIYFVTAEGNVVDCGLRLRVTSNNGINAFLGNSKANKNSSVVMKLQQDKVRNLIDNTNADFYNY